MNITIIFIKDEMNTEAKKVEFVPLLDFEDDYEILNDYPFTIRRKSNHFQPSESLNYAGYPVLKLNRYPYLKHVLIAKQFIPNDDPEHKVEIDHWNHDTTDYHLENLHWATKSFNQKNKKKQNGIEFKYVDEINDDSIQVTDYGNHQFEDYYYDEIADQFYFWNGKQYKKLHNNSDERGSLYVTLYDTDNRRVNVFYSKFKRLYDLI